jgi:hypothetical protein
VTLRIVPDPMGEELRALCRDILRVERFGYIPANPRRDEVLARALDSRTPWDALRLAAVASKVAAKVLNIAAHARSDASAADAAWEAAEILGDVQRLTLAAEARYR